MKPIDQLTPEELRMECAEAMGWTDVHSENFAPFEIVGVKPDGSKNIVWSIEHYGTDANAALQLAHTLSEKGWEPLGFRNRSTDKWYFEFCDSDGKLHSATATGPHAFELALSRAYLAVVRAGKEQC